jgi:hypothetical protein
MHLTSNYPHRVGKGGRSQVESSVAGKGVAYPIVSLPGKPRPYGDKSQSLFAI